MKAEDRTIKNKISTIIICIMMALTLTACDQAGESSYDEAEAVYNKLTVYFATDAQIDGVDNYIEENGLYYYSADVLTALAEEAGADIVFTDADGNIITVTAEGAYSSDTGKALIRVVGAGSLFASSATSSLTVRKTVTDDEDDTEEDTAEETEVLIAVDITSLPDGITEDDLIYDAETDTYYVSVDTLTALAEESGEDVAVTDSDGNAVTVNSNGDIESDTGSVVSAITISSSGGSSGSGTSSSTETESSAGTDEASNSSGGTSSSSSSSSSSSENSSSTTSTSTSATSTTHTHSYTLSSSTEYTEYIIYRYICSGCGKFYTETHYHEWEAVYTTETWEEATYIYGKFTVCVLCGAYFSSDLEDADENLIERIEAFEAHNDEVHNGAASYTGKSKIQTGTVTVSEEVLDHYECTTCGATKNAS